jgi:twinkle protein
MIGKRVADEVEDEQDDHVQIITPEDCYDEMTYYLEHGRPKGTTTYNEEIDQAWKWRPKEANIWTGYANEGKSALYKQMACIKALEENKKMAFASPEDMPAAEFFDDMIHTIAGQTTDKEYPNCISAKLYDRIYEMIKDLFFFVHIKPPNNTIKGVLIAFEKLKQKQPDLFACVTDPLLKFARPKGFSERDDIYAGYIGSLAVEFCRDMDVSYHLVMHQLTPTFDMMGKNEEGREKRGYVEPNMYRTKGGGSWADGFDNVLTVWRPNYAFDKLDTSVQFSSQKIKKQKLVGIPQKIPMNFDRKTNRYTDRNGEKYMFDFNKFIK